MTASLPLPEASTTWVLSRASAVHEDRRLAQEVLGLKARKARAVGDKKPARVGEHKARALGGDHTAADRHAMRRGVVLHLAAGDEDILPGPRRGRAQARFAQPAGERAVGDARPVRGQEFADTHGIAAGALQGGAEIGWGAA